jgi:tetratricopeptide (TPR) repeat protein
MKKIILSVAITALSIAVLAQRPKNKNLEAFDFNNKLYGKYRNEGKTDSVFYVAKQCLQLAQGAQNDSLLSRAYNLLGNAFLIASDFAPALDYYFKSFSFAEKKKDSYRMGVVAGNLSFTYYQIGNYQSGAEYGKRAVNALLSSPPSPDADSLSINHYYSALSNAYDNTGVSFIGLNQSDSALHYLQLAYSAVLKSKDKEDVFYKGALLTDLARTYDLLKEYKMAEDYFRQAIDLNDSLQMLQVLAYSVKYYGAFLLRNNRFTDVIHFGRMGIAPAILSKDKVSVIDIAGLLQNAYEATNQKDSAFYFSKMVVAYRDSVFSTQKMLAMQNTALKRQIDEREAWLQQAKLEEERKHNLQYAAIAVTLVSFVIVFFLLSHSIIANQKLIRFLGIIALLITFEFVNLYIHPFLAHATNDSPLLMLLVMVCIAALLVPLHHKLEHWITHKLVEKNNKIRLAAAKKTIAKLEGL